MTEFSVRGYVDAPGVRKRVETEDGQFPRLASNETLDRVEIMADGAMTPQLSQAYDAEGVSSLFGPSEPLVTGVTYATDATGNDWLVHHLPNGGMVSDRVFSSYDDMIDHVTGN